MNPPPLPPRPNHTPSAPAQERPWHCIACGIYHGSVGAELHCLRTAVRRARRTATRRAVSRAARRLAARAVVAGGWRRGNDHPIHREATHEQIVLQSPAIQRSVARAPIARHRLRRPRPLQAPARLPRNPPRRQPFSNPARAHPVVRALQRLSPGAGRSQAMAIPCASLASRETPVRRALAAPARPSPLQRPPRGRRRRAAPCRNRRYATCSLPWPPWRPPASLATSTDSTTRSTTCAPK